MENLSFCVSIGNNSGGLFCKQNKNTFVFVNDIKEHFEEGANASSFLF